MHNLLTADAATFCLVTSLVIYKTLVTTSHQGAVVSVHVVCHELQANTATMTAVRTSTAILWRRRHYLQQRRVHRPTSGRERVRSLLTRRSRGCDVSSRHCRQTSWVRSRQCALPRATLTSCMLRYVATSSCSSKHLLSMTPVPWDHSSRSYTEAFVDLTPSAWLHYLPPQSLFVSLSSYRHHQHHYHHHHPLLWSLQFRRNTSTSNLVIFWRFRQHWESQFRSETDSHYVSIFWRLLWLIDIRPTIILMLIVCVLMSHGDVTVSGSKTFLRNRVD